MPITKATASSIAPAAKGDLVVGSATNDASVLAVGSANQVLTVDSSTATGLKWAAASGGFSTWTTFTPTTKGGWTLGNGTLTSQYSVSGDLVWYRGMLTVGSTSVINTTIGIELPFNIITTYDDAQYGALGFGFARDVSASVYATTNRTGSPNQNDITFNGQIDIWDNNTPFTWATGDLLSFNVMYRKQ